MGGEIPPETMTPKFYQHFSLLQSTLAAFNNKCDCQGASASVSFEQVLSTKDIDANYNLWIAKFDSDTFGNQRFGGTIERVTELVITFLDTLISQTLAACIANVDEWYKEKPDMKVTLNKLYNALLALRWSAKNEQ